MFFFCTVDTQAKFLKAIYNPIQIVWLRQLGLLVGVLILLSVKGTVILKTKYPKLQIIRGTIVIISPICFVTGIMFVPLADAVVVTFIAPFLVIVLSALFLEEKIGLKRWISVVGGFVGTFIVIRPGSGILHPAVFLVLLAAALFSVRQVFLDT